MSLDGKVVLITGASSGIGAATAIHLASLGCKISLVSRDKSRLDSVAMKCRDNGAAAQDLLVCPHDVGKHQQCVQSLQETIHYFGGLDVLVNNAGMFVRTGFADVSMDEIDRTFNVNLKSAVSLSQEALPYLALRSPPGNIVNVSSIPIFRAKGPLAYNMSEAAKDRMTRCVALEVASQGIRVNSVNPGVIETEIFTRSGMSVTDHAAHMELCKKIHPLGRPGKADEVAKVIAFLASDDASFITGQTLAVDGGRSVHNG